MRRLQDSPEKLARDVDSQALHFLVPKLLTFFTHAQPLFRRHAVSCLNQFVMLMPHALVQRIDSYMQGLFALATDPSPDVRCCVCQALVMLLEASLDQLMPHMPAVVQYMLGATADPDCAVALEACELSVRPSRHPARMRRESRLKPRCLRAQQRACWSHTSAPIHR